MISLISRNFLGPADASTLLAEQVVQYERQAKTLKDSQALLQASIRDVIAGSIPAEQCRCFCVGGRRHMQTSARAPTHTSTHIHRHSIPPTPPSPLSLSNSHLSSPSPALSPPQATSLWRAPSLFLSPLPFPPLAHGGKGKRMPALL